MRLLVNRNARGSWSPVERNLHALGTSTERMSRFWRRLRVDLEPRVAANLALVGRGGGMPDYGEAFVAFEDVRGVEHCEMENNE
jgi:hypothetical protein